MLKISRLTDYATAVILFLQNDNKLYSSEMIASAVGLEIPTVSKVLKLLTKSKILSSIRGASGGYQLAKEAGKISLYDVIQAIEGQTAITECTKTDSLCAQEQGCDSRTGWQKVNQQIENILVKMTIARMAELNGVSTPDIKVMVKNYE
ncbi:MAG TPA: SUF system Fe-S cluster assembly regulator [Oceanospirillales bacterium]|nr:SUF system Fe-S cluster assembly regulator [Oceanospirillales bacterium]